MTASPEATALAIAAAEAASDKLADDIIAIDVSEHVVITDVFLLCSAGNERQVKAVVDGVEERLHGMGSKPLRREGEAQLWHLYAANGRFVDADQYRHDIMEALEHGNLS